MLMYKVEMYIHYCVLSLAKGILLGQELYEWVRIAPFSEGSYKLNVQLFTGLMVNGSMQ